MNPQHYTTDTPVPTPTKRLDSLPKDVRADFVPDLSYSTGHGRGPEDLPSHHGLHRRRDDAPYLAGLKLEEIRYYRGRARAKGEGSTTVNVFAVYGGNIILHAHGYVEIVRRRKDRQHRLIWNITGETVDYEDPKQRERVIAVAEHKAAAQAKLRIEGRASDARQRIRDAAHEALTSTKIERLEARVAEHDRAAKRLRAEIRDLEAPPHDTSETPTTNQGTNTP